MRRFNNGLRGTFKYYPDGYIVITITANINRNMKLVWKDVVQVNNLIDAEVAIENGMNKMKDELMKYE